MTETTLAQAAAAGTHDKAMPHKGAAYALAILMLIYGAGQLDRGVISLLMQPIKQEMQVSDTVLGLLSGFGFAAIYAVSALFVSRWADRGPRRAIIAGGLLFYSVMTALAGFAQGIWQLAATRVGVSLGESTGLAPSTAFLGDYFPSRLRARALAIFAGGSYIATFLFYPIIGWINQHYGWRQSFMAASVPGLVLSAVFFLTVKDPPRGGVEGRPATAEAPPLRETFAFLMGQRSALLMFVAAGFTGWTLFSLSMWGPTFLRRVHHLSDLEIGTYTGLIAGVAGLCGSISGGFVADWAARRDPRLRLLVPACACILACPLGLGYVFADDLRLTLALQACVGFLMVFPMGANWATLQSVVKVRMRALSAAILLVFSNCLGLGVGPLVVGLMADWLKPSLGDLAIRYALIVPCITCAIGGGLFVIAALLTPADAERARSA
jgi:predicted MFS family arabinose efflux permease